MYGMRNKFATFYVLTEIYQISLLRLIILSVHSWWYWIPQKVEPVRTRVGFRPDSKAPISLTTFPNRVKLPLRLWRLDHYQVTADRDFIRKLKASCRCRLTTFLFILELPIPHAASARIRLFLLLKLEQHAPHTALVMMWELRSTDRYRRNTEYGLRSTKSILSELVYGYDGH